MGVGGIAMAVGDGRFMFMFIFAAAAYHTKSTSEPESVWAHRTRKALNGVKGWANGTPASFLFACGAQLFQIANQAPLPAE